VLPPRTIIQRGGISMTEIDAYQEYIRCKHNAFCKAVMKQFMAGGGVALIGTTLVPLLSGLF